jgi:hypothetical protein
MCSPASFDSFRSLERSISHSGGTSYGASYRTIARRGVCEDNSRDEKDQCSHGNFSLLLGLGVYFGIFVVTTVPTTKDCRQHGQGFCSRFRRLESHDTIQS